MMAKLFAIGNAHGQGTRGLCFAVAAVGHFHSTFDRCRFNACSAYPMCPFCDGTTTKTQKIEPFNI